MFLAWLLNKFARIFSGRHISFATKIKEIMKTLLILSACLCLCALPCPAQFRTPGNADGATAQAPQTDTTGGMTATVQDTTGGMTAAAQDTTLLKEKVWTLKDCIDYAMKENISLQQSRLSEQSAEVDLKTSKAALLPSLSFSTSHSLINRPYQESSGTVSGTEILYTDQSTSYTGNYGLNAYWNLYTGGRNRKTIKQDDLGIRIAKLNLASTANTIQENIAQIYVQILYAAEAVKVNENTLEVSRAQCARGKELFEAGSISAADYAQLQSQVSSDNYQLVSAKATLQDYKLQLKQLLELEGREEMVLHMPEIDESIILSPLPDREAVFQTALGIRPEIESGKLSVSSSELDVKIAQSSYIPSLSLSAGIGTNHTSGTDFTFAEQIKNGWNNSVGLTLSVPIFNNRQTKSAVQKAEIQLESTKLDLKNTRKELYKTIENLWLNAYSAQQQYAAAVEQVKSASTSFNLVSEQFNLGMKNTVELLTEKNNLLSAEQQLLQAKYMAILNAQLLRFYQGMEIML